MRKNLFFLLLLLVFVTLLNSVPPCPERDFPNFWQPDQPSHEFPRQLNGSRVELPQSILVLRVDFADISFDLVPDYPDSLAHDKTYFERLMFHVATYYRDVSHGEYDIHQDNFVVWDEVLSLSQNMGYYGDDENSTERIAEFIVEIVEMADPILDFNDYDAIMIIHAGAGQEADLSGNNEDDLWSTFVTRRSLQAGLDPENDDFPGIETDDGIILTEFVVCPETEWQPDNNEGDTIYGIYGVYCHQFGHQVGLPTLYDNNSSNGSSWGIGAFGLMGTGVWNANGFVPPLPCAWSRYYLEWEGNNLIDIGSDQDNLELVFPQADDEITPKLYRVPISEVEYFLLENRQQNPDGSMINGEATFSFQLLPPEEQDVYPPDHPNAGQPKFNFMENTYEGCEWDFYCPGYGGPEEPEDGSGILIWHIDENIIMGNFDPDFESNSVNGDETHKGVDLEEADGIQHMDIYNTIFGYGSPDDAFRDGNNNYFGKMYLDGVLHLPSSDSYYGGNQLEIFDISETDSLMTFSVRFDWSLTTAYTGENPFPAAIVDLDGDQDQEIFYPMPDGQLYLWENLELVAGYPYDTSDLAALYAYDQNSGLILIPLIPDGGADYAGLMFLTGEGLETFSPPLLNRSWASGPMIEPTGDYPYRAFLPLKLSDGSGSELVILDQFYEQMDNVALEGYEIKSNLIYLEEMIWTVCSNGRGHLSLVDINPSDLTWEATEIVALPDSIVIQAALAAPCKDANAENLIITTTYPDTLVYMFDQQLDLLAGFPVKTGLNNISLPSIYDLDQNGNLDILIGGENSFCIINNSGEVFTPSKIIELPDSMFAASGTLALDLDQDNSLEIVGNMSRNRLTAWENINNNDYRMKRRYPIAFGEVSRTYPLLAGADSTIFLACANGTIFRHRLDHSFQSENWHTEFANLQRTASYLAESPENIYETEKIFVSGETYVYPNPLSNVYNSTIYNGRELAETITLRLMTSVDTSCDIKLFDIAGNIVHKEKVYCWAYQRNGVFLDGKNLANGMYFFVLKAKEKVKKLRFAIER